MTEPGKFRFYDHTRDVIALMRLTAAGDVTGRAEEARRRGLPIDLPEAKRLRETFWHSLEMGTRAMTLVAQQHGKTLDALLDEMQVQFEAELPEGVNDDEPPDRGYVIS